MVRWNYIRRVGACIACLVLTINLVCTSYTRVEAAPVAGYAIEEVVAALLVSLGITGATGEALNKAGLTPESARTILNSIYASAKEFSHDTDEAIDQTIMGAIADATELGKIVFKQGSKAWDALKEWAKSVGADIKDLVRPETDSALMSYYDISNLEYPYDFFYSYMSIVVAYLYTKYGAGVYSDYIYNCYNGTFYSAEYKYYVVYALDCASYAQIQGARFKTYADMEKFISFLQEKHVKTDSKVNYRSVVSPFDNYVLKRDYGDCKVDDDCGYGRLAEMSILSNAAMQMMLKYHVEDMAMSDAYQTVYNPAIPDTTDIVTPSNTITRDKDGSIAVTGDRTIDVALPIAWPVDLTKGIVIGKDIPIENVLDNTKTDEKTDGKDDNKEEENKPPITPDLPSGAVGDNLEADLKSIFPFCIPFDLIACIKGLAADPEAPVWNIKIPMPTNYTWTITIDMSDYDGVVRIFRIGEDLLFIVGLIVITRNLIRG